MIYEPDDAPVGDNPKRNRGEGFLAYASGFAKTHRVMMGGFHVKMRRARGILLRGVAPGA